MSVRESCYHRRVAGSPSEAPLRTLGAIAPGMPVRVSGLVRRFTSPVSDPVEVLAGVDLEVPASQFVALLGPSGCGKSTLLRLVAGLDAPRDRALHMLERVGLSDARERYPSQLSGGMQLRGSLARALVTDPRLLLLDEPFAALDEITRQRLDGLIHELWRERRFTALFVTHSLREAVFLAQRAVMLSRRPAKVVANRPIDLPDQRTAELRGLVAYNELVERLYQDLLVAEGGA
jgi:NitT/TauT family transport system ATP-binding protein